MILIQGHGIQQEALRRLLSHFL